MSEPLAPLAGLVLARALSPSNARLLAVLLAGVVVGILWQLWRSAGRSALGRALRWWMATLSCAGILAAALYLAASLPDDAETAAQIAASERLGHLLLPGPLAAAGALAAALASVLAAWRWRRSQLSAEERAALAAEWCQLCARWRRRFLVAGGSMGLVAAATWGVASIGPAQVPVLGNEASIGPAQVPVLGNEASGAEPAGAGRALWVGTAAGVSRLVPGSAQPGWQAFARPLAPLPSNRVTALVSTAASPTAMPRGDRAVWLATQAGVARFAPGAARSWQTFTPEDSVLPHRQVLALATDQRGNLWAATAKGGAMLGANAPHLGAPASERAFTNQNAPLLHQILDAVCVDHDGRVWFGGAGGVNVYEPGRAPGEPGSWPTGFTSVSTRGGLPADLVFACLVDSHGRVWFGTAGGASVFTPDPAAYGLGAFDEARWQTFTTRNSPLPHDKVHALVEDRQGRIWIGTEGGLAVLDERASASSGGKGQWRVFTAAGAAPAGLPHPWVQALLALPDGRIWAGTKGGLAVYDPAHPEQGWRSFHAHPLRRWTGLFWPPHWRENILSDDVTALAWGP